MRLTWALLAAALGPMLIAVAAALLRAENQAEQEAQLRLERSRQQARILLDRSRDETENALEKVSGDLSQSYVFMLDSLLGGAGPDAPPGAGAPRGASARAGSTTPLEIASELAQRRGLDDLEILDGEGRILADSRMDARVGLVSPRAGLPETGAQVGLLPLGTPRAGGSEEVAAFLGRRIVPLANTPISVAGGRRLDRDVLEGIAAMTGGPAFLVDPGGTVAVRAGSGAESVATAETSEIGDDDAGRIFGDVDLGEGWRIRVSAGGANVSRARRELGRILLGIGPFAVLTALILGVVLAQGISRPIRDLARRAEEISAEQAAPIRLHPDSDEIRRLGLAFDQMLEALARSEQQRVSAERIAAWQEVAKRIAHEVKNPLSPIRLAVENLKRTREKAPAELDRALEEESATILEEVESLRRLVDEFSQFARLPSPQLAACDPRAIVSSALALVAARIASLGVTTSVDADSAPRTIRADAEQIGRALKNVLLNALDAMEPVAERRLRITLSGGSQGQGAADERAGGAESGWLTIDVHDTGVGIEPAALGKIFEPYFTTRGERGGAGLGMAITHRIVHEHGGTIRAASARGRGTTITIRLPIEGPPDHGA